MAKKEKYTLVHKTQHKNYNSRICDNLYIIKIVLYLTFVKGIRWHVYLLCLLRMRSLSGLSFRGQTYPLLLFLKYAAFEKFSVFENKVIISIKVS